MLALTEQYQHPHWQKKRLEIFDRDGWKCTVCGATFKPLHVHHIYYCKDLHIWEYDNDSLKTLCSQCHKNLHQDMMKLAGHIAFEILAGHIDATDFIMSKQKQNVTNNKLKQASIKDALR